MNNFDDEYWQACIMKMHRPVSIYQKAGYLTLPLKGEKPPSNLIGYGYGSNWVSVKDPQNYLNSVELPKAFDSICANVYRYPLGVYPRNTEPFLCYGYTNKMSKMVRFDSGGPLVERGNHKAWGLSLNSQDLEMSENGGYPTFFVDLAKVADQINDAFRKLDSELH